MKNDGKNINCTLLILSVVLGFLCLTLSIFNSYDKDMKDSLKEETNESGNKENNEVINDSPVLKLEDSNEAFEKLEETGVFDVYLVNADSVLIYYKEKLLIDNLIDFNNFYYDAPSKLLSVFDNKTKTAYQFRNGILVNKVQDENVLGYYFSYLVKQTDYSLEFTDYENGKNFVIYKSDDMGNITNQYYYTRSMEKAKASYGIDGLYVVTVGKIDCGATYKYNLETGEVLLEHISYCK